MAVVNETASKKARLRADLLAVRRMRSVPELARARAAVRAHVLTRAAGINTVAAYVPLATEPGSTELLAELHATGTALLVPEMLADRDLDWTPWSPDGVGDPRGVDAIGEAELVLVPALAVAADGIRLGRGGGSYDRALRRCAPGALIAALLFDGELVQDLPRDPWDVPVSAAVTPNGWVELGKNTDLGFAR